MSEIGLRAMSGLGFIALLAVALLASNNRAAIDRRAIGIGGSKADR